MWPPTRLGHLALAAALVVGCETRREPQVPSPDTVEQVVDVETASLRRGSIAQRVLAPGSVVARRESRIGAEVSGPIVRVHVREGDRVEAASPLFEIDPAPFAMALRQAEAGHDVARAEHVQLASDLHRAQSLHREHLLSHQEVERLSTSVAVAQARARAASEAVELARHNLERTLVRAPYAGSIAERLADEGTTALVQPQTIVVVLQETAELEARAAIPESQMALVRVGDVARVRVEGVLDPIETHVVAVSDTIDRATRTYLVKMPVPNPSYRLKAGVFAQIEIRTRATEEVVLAPREALRIEDGRTRLLLIRDGHADALPIEVGAVTETDAEILAGAGAGELAIVGAAARTIAPGVAVRAGKPNPPPSP